jgi:hypothetical protein
VQPDKNRSAVEIGGFVFILEMRFEKNLLYDILAE